MRLLLSVLAAFAFVSSLSIAGSPATATVFGCDENGISDAITAADGGDPGPHSLACAPGDTIAGPSSWTVTSDLVLDGAGATIECALGLCFNVRALRLTFVCTPRIIRQFPDCMDEFGPAPTVELRRMTLDGGGVEVRGANVTLDEVALTAPFPYPGAPYPIWVMDYFVGNYGRHGSLRLLNSHVMANTEILGGSGVTVEAGTHSEIIGSTIASGTEFLQYGFQIRGSILSPDETIVDVLNSTISNIWNNGTLNVVNSTILAKGEFAYAYTDWASIRCSPDSPSSVIDGSANATITNSIIKGECRAGDGGPFVPPEGCSVGPFPEFSGTITTGGGNVESSGNSCYFTDSTDQVNVSTEDLSLGPLSTNGGPTPTRPLWLGSVAIDAAVLANCPMEDQRGEPRPEAGGTACDSGAFEAVPEPSQTLLGAVALASVAILTAIRRKRGADTNPHALVTPTWLA